MLGRFLGEELQQCLEDFFFSSQWELSTHLVIWVPTWPLIWDNMGHHTSPIQVLHCVYNYNYTTPSQYFPYDCVMFSVGCNYVIIKFPWLLIILTPAYIFLLLICFYIIEWSYCILTLFEPTLLDSSHVPGGRQICPPLNYCHRMTILLFF